MGNVEFDGDNLLIKVNEEVTTIDIQTDLYSDWKEWFQTGTNSKFLPALRTIGGDPTVQEKVVAPYFFLMNGWKIKPYSWNHTLNLVGNLFVDNPETYGSNIIVPPDGYFTVLVNMSTTSDASKLLVGSGVTEQDKQDITHLIEQSGILAKEVTLSEMQEQMTNVQVQTRNIEQHHILHRKIEGDHIKYYDGITVVMKYRMVKDKDGNIIELIPEAV